MNRGRHKKSNKEKELYTQTEIMDIIQKELYTLLSVYRKPLKYSMQNYYAKALISSNEGKNFNVIVAWYINSNYYVNNFLEKVKNAFDEATIKNSVYLIKFEFGNNLKIFKYKA